MIIFLQNPTETEIEFVKKLLKENKSGGDNVGSPNKDQNQVVPWLNPVQFTAEMARKGYKCATSKTRKKLCNEYGITFEKHGKELWFRNELEKIPNRMADLM